MQILLSRILICLLVPVLMTDPALAQCVVAVKSPAQSAPQRIQEEALALALGGTLAPIVQAAKLWWTNGKHFPFPFHNELVLATPGEAPLTLGRESANSRLDFRLLAKQQDGSGRKANRKSRRSALNTVLSENKSSRKGMESLQRPGLTRRRLLTTLGLGGLIAALIWRFRPVTKLVETENAPLPSHPIPLPAVTPLPPDQLHDQALVRQKFIEVIESSNGFAEIINALVIPVSLGYEKEDLRKAVAAFLEFLRAPTTRFTEGPSGPGAPSFSVNPESHEVTFNPAVLNDALVNRPLEIFHEAMHFLAKQSLRSDPVASLTLKLLPLLEMSPQARRQPLEKILGEPLFSLDSLKHHPEGRDVAAAILQASWQDELEAHYLTTAAWAALAQSRAEDLKSYMRHLPHTTDNALDLELARLYRPEGINTAFEEAILDNILGEPGNLNLFIALARAEYQPNFSIGTFEVAKKNLVLQRRWLAWARKNILHRSPAAAQDEGYFFHGPKSQYRPPFSGAA